MVCKSGRTARIFYAIFLLCCISGCTSGMQKIYFPAQVIQIPEINKLEKRAIGETLVRRGELVSRPVLSIEKELIIDQKIQSWIVPRGDYFLTSRDETREIYEGEIFYQGKLITKSGIDNCEGNNCRVCGGICVSRKDGSFSGIYNGFGCFRTSEKPELGFRKISEMSGTTDTQEFIYSGRVGKSLRFRYREFRIDNSALSDSCPADALGKASRLIKEGFTQDLTYDLDEGNVVGFRGLRLEVISVTNSEITYRVISHF